MLPCRSVNDPKASTGWRHRLSALSNLPFILKLVWRAAPSLVAVSLAARLVIAFLPVTALWVSKLIIDLAVWSTTHPGPVPVRMWWLVSAEFLIAATGGVPFDAVFGAAA